MNEAEYRAAIRKALLHEINRLKSCIAEKRQDISGYIKFTTILKQIVSSGLYFVYCGLKSSIFFKVEILWITGRHM